MLRLDKTTCVFDHFKDRLLRLGRLNDTFSDLLGLASSFLFLRLIQALHGVPVADNVS